MRPRPDEKASSDPWAPYAPDHSSPWNLRRVVHVHRRAGIAASWDELSRELKDGPETAINRLLEEGRRYARYREAIRLPEKKLIKLRGEVGLHPAMRDAGKLLESNRLAIVHGIGYRNPNRSHFRSREIWQSARIDPLKHNGFGWIGRALDGGSRPADGARAALLIGPDSPPPARRGRRSVSAALDRLRDYAMAEKEDHARREAGGNDDELETFLRRSLVDAYAAADWHDGVSRHGDAGASYPQWELARRLHLTASLIKAGLGTRVYYMAQGDYDTHGHQLARHAPLLEERNSLSSMAICHASSRVRA